MRLPHDRLFFWLAPLLFAWAAPDLAAQTWTTVWTPDGAPAMHPAAQGETRDYNTNCYPCKEWEDYGDGKGKWTYYPKGTTPTVCAGDTNDYTCKTCDGNGGVTNAPGTTTCDAGQGCGCCVDGKCWAPTPDCKNPMEVSLEFIRAGDCPCSGNELGCLEPPVTAHADAGVCYDQCKWKPAPKDFKLYYLSSTCPNRCQSSIGSTNDVNVGNYCAVIKALDERIEKEKESSINPPPPPSPDAPPKPPEPFCFSECNATHENEHVKQMEQLWNSYAGEIRDALSAISVSFNCDTARTPEDAGKAMASQVGAALDEVGGHFAEKWDENERANEKNAYAASLKCLEDLKKQIQDLAAANGWTCP